jgi:2-polyprenyl-6-methoxyphenol hydroxylase-like FAD-dependent oxidoreductase
MSQTLYDAIVLGARVAGSPTAMLLARKGYRVLLVDRASFPSDTMSTHQIQLPGSAALQRWGLLEHVLATGLDAAERVRVELDGMILEGQFPVVDGVGAVYSPRRYLLDKLLLDAAAQAGAEVRENCMIQELVWEDGRVVGVRGQVKSSPAFTERARVVIGADGKHSLVAKAVDAPRYDEQPALTCGYYTYWAGVPMRGGEIYRFGKRMLGAWPTNDGLTMIYVAWPTAEFNAFRADVEGSYMTTIDLAPGLAARVRQGKRAERIVGSGEMPNFYCKPWGPGWALVGDAGYIKDPITGLGISDAFRDAESLAHALDDGFAGRAPLDAALKEYERQRNETSKPFYDFTLDTARMEPLRVEQVELLRALERNPAAASHFLGVLTTVVKPADFFAPQNIFRLIGARGMAKVMWSKLPRPAQRISA